MSEKQVEKEHYRFGRYASVARWGSYYWQLYFVTEHEPKSILEVGVGDSVFGRYLKEVLKIQYTSVDIDPELFPDVVGDIEHLPFPDRSFDTACAFEILEHLPLTNVSIALAELHRVTKERVFVSVPDRRPHVQFLLKIPGLPRLRFLLKLPIARRGVYGGQHYWEIGWDGFTLHKIKKVFSEKFVIEKDFVPFENPHHHFFVLKKR